MNGKSLGGLIYCRDMVRNYLEQNGFDGLYCDECGCEVSDLMPCGGEGAMDCVAGYKHSGCTDSCGMGCDFHIGARRMSASAGERENIDSAKKSTMKYYRLTGPAGIGKSYFINRFPAGDSVQVVDLLVEKEPNVRDGIKALVLDHADCKPESVAAWLCQADKMGVEHSVLVGQDSRDFREFTDRWALDMSLKGGFRDLSIEISVHGRKKIYLTDDLPRRQEDVGAFINKMQEDVVKGLG